ncbi:carbonic anhydrase [Paramagnetospirillum kuznetsovii]|uniref:Carbonic anhydrase n=1 Tax=Paramagnetospirillum kuznetsovii TaxID=2053833 RepID=A0A364NT87_9PROT|nr:NeuD/PglB/VioB family sugar acetyltransferase [Paramagnetospirillum kuznetsovii]RAU20252.1 carbonic anhydrase [Paramagnetospirillum kuznetsovii]
MIPLIILGGGGHAVCVIDMIRLQGLYRPVGILDPALAVGAEVGGVPVLGDDSQLERLRTEGLAHATLGIGGDFRPDSTLRRRIGTRAREAGFAFPPLIHPSATIAQSATLEDGCQILAGAVIAPGARLARDVALNHTAVADHDSGLGAGLFTGTGAILAGGAVAHGDVQIGAGATILPRVTLGRGCVVGAGAVVVRDVAPSTVVCGNPARAVMAPSSDKGART